MVDIVNNTQVFNISVPIPDNLLVVDKSEYLDLLRKTDEGQWWSIDEVVSLLGFSRTKIVNDILLNPRLKKEMDISVNPNGFIVYPQGKGNPYKFLASRTRKYFEENFSTILLGR